MKLLLLFLSQFAVVFLLGLQSQSVRDSRYTPAAITSLLIGAFQAFQWKIMPQASIVEMSVWLTAGPLAIVAAIWLHPKIIKRRVHGNVNISDSVNIDKVP